MAITCPNCGHQYDSTLFVFEQSIQCDCGKTFDISRGHLQTARRPIRGVLIDIAGVLYIGEEPITGASAAVQRLQESALPIRFVTNTTRSTAKQILSKLDGMGLKIHSSSLLTAPIATRNYVRKNGLRPFLLVHPNVREEFSDINCDPRASGLRPRGAAGRMRLPVRNAGAAARLRLLPHRAAGWL